MPWPTHSTIKSVPNQKIVFDTPWFQLVERMPEGYESPHYSIQTRDYVSIIAVDASGALLLVRQFRPTLWKETLELPSGHIEDGQTPEQAARQELIDETGHLAEHFELLCVLSPDTGRLGNKMWCFFAGEAYPTNNPEHQMEVGVSFVRYSEGFKALHQENDFCSALNRAALFAAVVKGKVSL